MEQFNHNMEEGLPILTTASEILTSSTTYSLSTPDNVSASGNGQKSVFSPLAAPFQSRLDNTYLSTRTQQEPRPADTALSTNNIDEILKNLHINNSDSQLGNLEHNPYNFYPGSRANTVLVSNVWSENTSSPNVWPQNSASGTRNGKMFDNLIFLEKSVPAADPCVSRLTREQLSVLRSIPHSVLYEALQAVVKARSDKRSRRALPYECAFCKNNGENEEVYLAHMLKDCRGRVLCPVLRAFRCPRCGATGDRAHTIKHCPKNAGIERSRLLARRRMPSSSLVLGAWVYPEPATPAPSPSVSSNMYSLWSDFGIN